MAIVFLKTFWFTVVGIFSTIDKRIGFEFECASTVQTTRRQNDDIGIMFLGEVALGKEHNIKVGDSSLTCAPKGYDSIVARGRTEPGKQLFFLTILVCTSLSLYWRYLMIRSQYPSSPVP